MDKCPVDEYRVRLKWLEYCPCSVLKLDDIRHLQKIVGWYTPKSQPRTEDEWLYLELVREAAEWRIHELETQQRRPPSTPQIDRRRFCNRHNLEEVRRNLVDEFDNLKMET